MKRALLILLLLPACMPSADKYQYACKGDADCGSGWVCIRGLCADGSTLPTCDDGRTLIMVTHDLTLARKATRIWRLADGQAAPGCEYACVRTAGGVEACDRIDNNCDGRVDEGFDLTSNPSHCGQCNRACSAPFSTTTCSARSFTGRV